MPFRRRSTTGTPPVEVEPPSRKSLFFSFLHISATNGIKTIATILSSLVVARILGPVLMGHLGTARLFPLYGNVLTLGATLGMGQRIPILRGKGEIREAERVRRSTLWFVYVLSAGSIACSVLLALFLFRAISGTSLLVLLGGLALFTVTILNHYVLVHMGTEKMFSRLSITNVVAAVAAVLLIPLAFYGLPGGIGRAILLVVIEAIAGLWLCRMSLRAYRDYPVIRESIAVGLPILGVSFLHQYAYVLDRTLVRVLLGAEALGLYTIASLMITGVSIVPQALTRVLYPTVGELFGRTGDPRSAAREVLRVLPMVLGAAVLVIPAAALLVKPLVMAFLPGYAEGIPAAQIAGIASAGVLAGYGGFYFNVISRVRFIIIFQIIGIACQAVASIVLYRLGFGLSAFVIGTTVGVLTYAVATNGATWLIARGTLEV